MEEPVSSHSFQANLAGMLRQARPYKSGLFLIALLGIVSAIANGAVPYVTGRFFDALIGLSHGGNEQSGLLPLWMVLLGLWALIQILANGVDWIIDRKRREIDTNISGSVQAEGFIHLFRLPLSYHSNEHINGLLSKISNAAWRISATIRTVVQVTPEFLSVIVGIWLASTISPAMAGVLLGGAIIYGALLVFMLRPIAQMDHIAHEAWNDAWNDAAAAVHQISSVKQAAAEEYEVSKTRASLQGSVLKLWYKLERKWSNIGFFQRAIVFLTQLIIFISSVHLVQQGAITVGGLIALNGYAALFLGPLVQLGYSWQTVQNGLTAGGQLERLFTTKEEEYHPADEFNPTERSGHISFENVSFSYETDKPGVLHDLSLEIRPGESVALVGESGAGKSTVISLISGYYFPTQGKITVDHADTRVWDLLALRRRIAVVPQEVALFNESIRANIRYGSFEASDAAVERASQQAHIDEFIRGLPDGYETLVGERGIKLSVGQKQRIAIARAILRDPEILILDEPTSALDAETEQYVTASLGELMKGRTTLIIAHRLSTVRKANTILVLKEGRIAEKGNHRELMEIPQGIYRSLYNLHIGFHE
jgi:ABC-type multidrug transport system fused ATPase/permease subunit